MMAREALDSNSFFVGRALWRLFILIQLLQPLCSAADPNCFTPTGIYLPDDIPCRPDARESSCCGKGWACLANGLCRSTSVSPNQGANVYAQGSCTDATWKSASCANPCKASALLTPCGDTTYCCGSCSCRNATQLLNIQGDPSPFVTVGFAVSTSTSSVASTSSLSSFGSTSSTAAASSTSALDPSGLSSSATSSPSPSVQPAHDSKNATKVGLGVGIPMAALIVALVGLLVWRERYWRRKRLQDKQERMVPSDWGSGNNSAQAHELLPKRVIHEMPSGASPTLMNELPSSR